MKSTTRKDNASDRLLTEVELELMNVIWELQSCTVKDVQTALPAERDLAYTSVATIMKILEQKGFVHSEKEERAHRYRPLLARSEYESTSLRHLARNLFHGDPKSMVLRLLDDSDLSQKEIDAIRALLEEKSRT